MGELASIVGGADAMSVGLTDGTAIFSGILLGRKDNEGLNVDGATLCCGAALLGLKLDGTTEGDALDGYCVDAETG